jgi:aminodeoxyfutalosine synthase
MARGEDREAMNSESRVIEAIREKVEAGERLSFQDGLALDASNDLFAL